METSRKTAQNGRHCYLRHLEGQECDGVNCEEWERVRAILRDTADEYDANPIEGCFSPHVLFEENQ